MQLLENGSFRVKDTSSRSLCYPVYVVIVFHLVKQSAKPLGFLFFVLLLKKSKPDISRAACQLCLYFLNVARAFLISWDTYMYM